MVTHHPAYSSRRQSACRRYSAEIAIGLRRRAHEVVDQVYRLPHVGGLVPRTNSRVESSLRGRSDQGHQDERLHPHAVPRRRLRLKLVTGKRDRP